MENKITQLRKGILELAVLGALSRGRHYGYSLVRTISGTGDIDLTEGTIYPILGRWPRRDSSSPSGSNRTKDRLESTTR